MPSTCHLGRTRHSLRNWLRMVLSLSTPIRERQVRPRAKQWSGRSRAALLPQRALILGTLKQTRHDPSAPSLIGGKDQDYSRSDASKRYSSELCKRLAQVLLTAPRPAAIAHGTPGDESDSAPVEELTAAQARPRRAASNVSYDQDGRLATAVVSAIGAIDPPSDFVCPIAQRAVTASVGRAAYSLGPRQLHGEAFEAAAIDAEVVCVCAPTFDLETMDLVFKTSTFVMSTVAGPVPIALDERLCG